MLLSVKRGLDDEQRQALGEATLESLLSDPKRCARERGLDSGAIKRLASDLAFSLSPLKSAKSLLNNRLHADALLSTGVGELDSLLGGGLATGEVTEIIGGAGSGKTQLSLLACAALAVSAGDGMAMYVDTSLGFSAKRMHDFTTALGAQACPPLSRPECKERLEQRMFCTVATGLAQLLHILDDVDMEVSRARGRVAHEKRDDMAEPATSIAGELTTFARLRLLVVDSVVCAMLPEHTGRSSAADVQLARLQQRLRELACRHRLAVVVTNGTVHERTHSGPACARPAFGHAWAHVAHTRLHVQALAHARDDAAKITCSASIVQVTKCSNATRRVRSDRAVQVQLGSRGEVSAAML